MSSIHNTWRAMIQDILDCDVENEQLLFVAPNKEVLDVVFNSGYGTAEGPEFLAWSENYVFFPLEYDGSEYVGYAPRNPVARTMRHQ